MLAFVEKRNYNRQCWPPYLHIHKQALHHLAAAAAAAAVGCNSTNKAKRQTGIANFFAWQWPVKKKIVEEKIKLKKLNNVGQRADKIMQQLSNFAASAIYLS